MKREDQCEPLSLKKIPRLSRFSVILFAVKKIIPYIVRPLRMLERDRLRAHLVSRVISLNLSFHKQLLIGEPVLYHL